MLIFDKFPTRVKAEAFAKDVCDKFGRTATVYDSQDESNAVDPFPFALTPPIVLVQRFKVYAGERQVAELVADYGGRYAGT